MMAPLRPALAWAVAVARPVRRLGGRAVAKGKQTLLFRMNSEKLNSYMIRSYSIIAGIPSATSRR